MFTHFPKMLFLRVMITPLVMALAMMISVIIPSYASDDATIIMYHRFGENRLPSTNIQLDVFEAHLQTIRDEGWTVMPLSEIVSRLKSGETLPDKALAITVDDAFTSVYTEAFPRLQEYGYPFTLFIATDSINRGLQGYATWDQIREMQAAGVEIGSQSHTHPHMHRLSDADIRKEITTSNATFLKELGITPRYFAYPYGEYSTNTRDIIKDMGFEAAFGQASGIAHASIDAYEWPRFAFNESYGDVKRLKLAVEAKALPISDMTGGNMVLDQNPPFLGFTVAEGIEPLSRLICFASGMGRVEVIQLGRRVEVRLPKAFSSYRNRINCTMPVVENGKDTGRFRWYSRQFVRD
ncbi:MAG: polysaccharide deacetylase family protein [Pseudomonadota bacterium]|nr:polysaccharide deacetylase family protein [Pseudomonadota bacterium]